MKPTTTTRASRVALDRAIADYYDLAGQGLPGAVLLDAVAPILSALRAMEGLPEEALPRGIRSPASLRVIINNWEQCRASWERIARADELAAMPWADLLEQYSRVGRISSLTPRVSREHLIGAILAREETR